MNEIIHHFHQGFLAKEQALRERAALRKIQKTRELEANHPKYVADSSAKDYLKEFLGLGAFFNYANDNNPSVPILEIGTGTSKAIGTLASRIGQNVSFIATGLLSYPGMNNLSESVKVVLAAAEFLPLQENSIGAAFSKQGIAFAEPKLSVARLDKVLVPGAPVKFTFPNADTSVYGPTWERLYKKWGYSPTKLSRFNRLFQNLHYDTAILETPQDTIFGAIKPGGSMSARDLLSLDQETLQEQLALIS